MEVASTDLFGLAQQKLGWLENRQKLLAQNIANADTPGYRPQDERPFESALSGFAMTPVQTNAMHIPVGQGDAGAMASSSEGVSPDGNQVSTEAEMTKVAATDNQQRFVTNLYSKYMAMFSIALDKG